MIYNENLLKNEINQRLIALCNKRSGGNGSKFAELCEIKQTTMSGYLQGNSIPNVENMLKIAEKCDVTVGWLITGEGPSKKQADIAATIEPGAEEKRTKLRLAKERNILLRKVVEWLDETFTDNDEQALFFYEDMKERYPSFAEFVDKKRPGREKRETAASA